MFMRSEGFDYIFNHEIIMRIDCPISKVLRKPELVGRMISWSVELSEFRILYEPKGPIKSQCLADFTSELQVTLSQKHHGFLYVDGSSNKHKEGAGVVLEGLRSL